MKKLNADIKNQTFERVYLLYGNEEYLKQNFKNKLLDALDTKDSMNFMQVQGKDLDLSSLQNFTDTMPFFSDRRVLLLSETGLFKGASEGFSEWIDTLPETANVIFVETETDKRNRLFKKVSEKGYAAELSHPDAETRGKWILSYIKNRNLKISRDAYERILEATDESLVSTQNELEKICDYCMNEEGITLPLVDEILTPVVTSRIFDMIDAVARREQQKALDLYADLLSLKEPPLRILNLITRQFNQLLIVKEMAQNGKRQDEMAKALSVPPFIPKKLLSMCTRFSMAKLKNAISLSVDLEESVKLGNLTDTLAVELLIFKLLEKE